MTVGQTAFELATNYRAQADRLVHFGAQVQELAASKNIHFVTMRGRDEGLIMYVNQARFADESEALVAWHRGDGLILDDRDLEKLKPQLNPYEVALQTPRPAAKSGYYYFIVPARGSVSGKQ
jgi:hypothetical protein